MGLREDVDRCRTNLEMLELARQIEEIPKQGDVFGVPVRPHPDAPEGTVFFVPSHAALVAALEHDPTVDLRRYFASITNLKI